VSSEERYLSPSEAARRLGVSAKALRVYEERGFVKPVRTGAGWRSYGPEQMARLHQVLALKRLGLPLARIGELLRSRSATLAQVLAWQEQVLAEEGARVANALALVRAARRKLAAGAALSIDDLATLTKETTMSVKPGPEEMKKLFDPHVQKHFSADEIAQTAKRQFDPVYTQKTWDDLIAEARALLAAGEAIDAPATQALAMRWRAMVEMFTQGNPDVENRVGQVWQSALADPKAAPKLPMGPDVFAFMGRAMAVLKK
jgi:DNA-binding transcriptional MerR regulator